jgi:hypothetical protein
MAHVVDLLPSKHRPGVHTSVPLKKKIKKQTKKNPKPLLSTIALFKPYVYQNLKKTISL